MKEYIERQVEQRQRAWEAAKALLDKAASEKRDLTAEEEASYQKMNADLNERAARIEALKADAEREAKIEAATREIAGQVRPTQKAVTSDADIVRSIYPGVDTNMRPRDRLIRTVPPQIFFHFSGHTATGDS